MCRSHRGLTLGPAPIVSSEHWRRALPLARFSRARGCSERPSVTARWPRSARVVVVLIVAVLMMTGVGGAVADDGFNHAGVVVRHGDGRITYAYVAFPEERLTGIELLARTGIEQITLPFGGLGAAVCQLEGEGCDVTVCRRRVCQGPSDNDPYWRYFRREPSGEWRPLALGASATEVHDGDIDGWSWTDDEPRLPAVSLADIARIAGADATSPDTGQVPPAVRTILPDGYDPAGSDRQDAVTYAAAGGVIAIVAGGALLAARRSRHLARPAA